jgi:hypothetical protein
MKFFSSVLVWILLAGIAAWVCSGDSGQSEDSESDTYPPAKHGSAHPEDCFSCMIAEMTQNPFDQDTVRAIKELKAKRKAAREGRSATSPRNSSFQTPPTQPPPAPR